MDELTVTRWARFGMERLYVETTEGAKVGYYDVKTGQAVLDRPELADAFHAAVTPHIADASTHTEHSVAVTSQPASQTLAAPAATDARMITTPVLPEPPAVPGPLPMAHPDPAPVTPDTTPVAGSEPTWSDLSDNRAGQAAKEQAEAHLAAMKERSRVGTFLAQVFDVKTDERAWRVGAKGEEAVGSRLEKLLNDGWHVLHAVPVGTRGSDIDHVLIGPGGVYTINTKNHPGKKIWVSPVQIRVDGHKVEYLRNSRFEADRTRKLLTAALGWEPPVRSALVLLTGTIVPDVTIKGGGPEDVLILDRMDVPRVFKKAARRLTPESVTEVFEVARRSTTWTG